MEKLPERFQKVVEFHGHVCPGLALGYRVALAVLEEFKVRAKDEELVAIVENDACPVDAIQVMLGCTFGKGNLIYKDYGKQVYTFFLREDREAVRISVRWVPPEESDQEEEMWRRYSEGDRSEEVIRVVHDRKARKIRSIIEADKNELLHIEKVSVEPPEKAKLYPSVRCSRCGEKVMETRTVKKGESIVCIPCSEMEG